MNYSKFIFMQKINVEKSNEFDLNNKFVSVGMFVP